MAEGDRDLLAAARFCEERAIAYGALRAVSPTAIALDRAAEALRREWESRRPRFADLTAPEQDGLIERMAEAMWGQWGLGGQAPARYRQSWSTVGAELRAHWLAYARAGADALANAGAL